MGTVVRHMPVFPLSETKDLAGAMNAAPRNSDSRHVGALYIGVGQGRPQTFGLPPAARFVATLRNGVNTASPIT